MGKCTDCANFDVCMMHYRQKCELTYDTQREINFAMKQAQKASPICEHFKNKKQIIDIPYPVQQGDKLFFVYEERNGKYYVSEEPDVVTAVFKDGFFTSSITDSDGTFDPDRDGFYRWEDLGTNINSEYFFTKEEAIQAINKANSAK